MTNTAQSKSRIMLAAAIALVGVVVGWRALNRSAPAPAATAAAPTPPAETLKPYPYEIKPKPGAESDAARRLVESLRVAPPADLAAAGVTRFHMDALADHAADRLTLMLEGAPLDSVVESARATGMEWTEPDLSPIARARSEKWAEQWLDAPMSAERAFVRTFISGEPGGFAQPEEWQVIKLRSLIRPRLPEIPPGTRIIELVIPALVRTGAGAAPSMPASVGISYFWDSTKQQWVGGMFTVYTAERDTNRLMPPP